jgi:hypothetical protein
MLYKLPYLYLILIILCHQAIAHAVEPERIHPSGEITSDQHKIHRRTIITASNTTTISMPTPYDTLSYNFANTTCLTFYKNWRANTTITNCHAISLLLENSNAFFHTLSSASQTSYVLDTACAANVSSCNTIMANLAADLLDPSNCGEDYDAGNTVVQGTYRDLIAYEPMYRATCLTNPLTEDYCFVDAISNTTQPEDYNVYFMPLGNALGSGSKPSCGRCLAATMGLFAQWATVDGQPLVETYLASAGVVNAHCGVGFADTNVTVGSDVVGGSGRVGVSGIGVLGSVLVALWLV